MLENVFQLTHIKRKSHDASYTLIIPRCTRLDGCGHGRLAPASQDAVLYNSANPTTVTHSGIDTYRFIFLVHSVTTLFRSSDGVHADQHPPGTTEIRTSPAFLDQS